MTNTTPTYTTDELVHVMMTEQYGRGVFAMKNIDPIKLIESAEILVLNEHDTQLLNNQTELKDYTFTFDDKRDCLVMGIGEMFNHSDDPNVSYQLMSINGRFKMLFYTTRPIKAGEQLFIDYNADVKESFTSKPNTYTTNLVA